MRIRSLQSVPISYRVPQRQNVRLGIGRAVKRDAVLDAWTDADFHEGGAGSNDAGVFLEHTQDAPAHGRLRRPRWRPG